ncbi:MAG: amidohydrolase [Candidatus Limnocylindria bacterium]
MGRPDLLITGAHVVTVDAERRVLNPGYVAVSGHDIESVGLQSDCPYQDAEHVTNAAGKVLLPGFINAHTHALHSLMRGGLSDDRVLYDWLLNVVRPGLSVYTEEDVRIAATLFCIESIRSGITTFVDNAEFIASRFDMAADVTIDTYKQFGVRAIYARMFYDTLPAGLENYAIAVESKEPEIVRQDELLEETSAALESIGALIKRHHGSGDGRIQVWPSPGVAVLCTREGLLGAKQLAQSYGAMVTIHVAESAFDRFQAGVSSVEYLASIGFLGPDVLAGHCVQIDENDIRILRNLGVKVANNAVSNLFLGSGVAPVAEMQAAGIVVGLGTDDGNCNCSTNIISDMKIAALAQKGKYRHPTAVTAEKALEMSTIDGARAVGMEDMIGSIEAGKKADLVLIDLSSRAHLVPMFNVPSVLVYQAMGDEIDTVIVDGQILMEGGILRGLSLEQEREILHDAQRASEGIVERAGFRRLRDRGWPSFRAV